ncbi:hypothetical protein Sjap_022243 [Stephania japonica]|uniref:Uncharacterized protein n=1 Tax=Stephania japonica TaxID=461633 RepID=A0AAP0EP13_9MAGN
MQNLEDDWVEVKHRYHRSERDDREQEAWRLRQVETLTIQLVKGCKWPCFNIVKKWCIMGAHQWVRRNFRGDMGMLIFQTLENHAGKLLCIWMVGNRGWDTILVPKDDGQGWSTFLNRLVNEEEPMRHPSPERPPPLAGEKRRDDEERIPPRPPQMRREVEERSPHLKRI